MPEVKYTGKFWSGSPTKAIQNAAWVAKAYGQALIKARTPVDTGKLKSSWQSTLDNQGITFLNNTPYASYVEYGTRKMAPRYMLTDSIPDIQRVFQQELAKELGKQLGAKVLADIAPRGFKPMPKLTKTQKQDIRQARPRWQKYPYQKRQVGVVRW